VLVLYGTRGGLPGHFWHELPPGMRLWAMNRAFTIKALQAYLEVTIAGAIGNQVSQRRQMASPQSKLTRNISLCGSVIFRGPCVATIPRARVLALAFSIPLLPLVYICPVANLRKAFANVASLALIHLQPSLGRCISRIGKHSFVLRVCSLGDAHCWKLTVFEHWHCIRLACFHW
jgi:hypothetical protein